MIGSDFVPTVLTRSRLCFCGKQMYAGHTYLASIKDGKVKRWCCTEECRQEFDDRVWQAIANKNASRRRRSKF